MSKWLWGWRVVFSVLLLLVAFASRPVAAADVNVTVRLISQTVSDGVILRIYVRNNETDVEKTVGAMAIRGFIPAGTTLVKCWTGGEPADDADEAHACATEASEAVFFSPGIGTDTEIGPYSYKVQMSVARADFQARVTWPDNEVKSSILSVGTTAAAVAVPPPSTTAAAPAATGDPNRRYFPETGHNIGFGFKAFWEANNGAFWLGPPLTEELFEGGKVVQYFTNGRLEWSEATGITVGQVGRDYLRAVGALP